jgi:hypothetical protein
MTVDGCISDVSITGTREYFIGFNSNYLGGFLGGLNENPDKDNSAHIGDRFYIKNSISYHVPELYSEGGSLVNTRGAFYGATMNPDTATTDTRIDIVNCATLDTLAEGLALTTDNEASIRFNSPTGIRFYNSVSGLYGTLVRALGADNVKMGTIIAPKQLIQTAGAFTKEALDALNSTTATYLDVEYRGEWYETDKTNNDYTYVGGVANILEDNYDLEYCGIGYISYNDGTGWKTIYASYDEGTAIPAFSVRALAESVIADDKATAEEKKAVEKYLANNEQ